MKLKVNYKNLIFDVTFYFMFLILMCEQVNLLPLMTILRKAKYLYILLGIAYFLYESKFKKKILYAFVIWMLFFTHTILFGYVITNDVVSGFIRSNADQMLTYLLMVGVTYFYVSENDMFGEFISVAFYSAGTQQLLVAIRYHSDFILNPFWGLKQAFTASIRYQTTFGYTHQGYLSNSAWFILVLSVFYFELYRNDKKIDRRFFWGSLILNDFLAMMMIISAAERAGIICAFIFATFYIVFVLIKFRITGIKKYVLVGAIVIAILVMIANGTFDYIWENSNRSLNITVNYPIFKKYGSILTGMGFVGNSAFLEDVNAFGVKTSALDMYYVYIFFTTGIIGCVLIGSALVLMLIKYLTNKRTNINITMIGLYLTMLFFAFWQCMMVTYRYPSPLVLFTIMLCGLRNDFCLEEDLLLNGETYE